LRSSTQVDLFRDCWREQAVEPQRIRLMVSACVLDHLYASMLRAMHKSPDAPRAGHPQKDIRQTDQDEYASQDDPKPNATVI